jgi:Dolichyl-phosphate-mannose-protein mannosyltransferase
MRRVRRLSGYAWGAIAVTAGFIAVNAWWLTQDRAVQQGDAAQHLFVAFGFHDLLKHGELGQVFDSGDYYPPATFLLGAAAIFVGGWHVAVPILAQNVVFAPLLALACYQIARLLAGPRAGLLAVVFALGAPLVIEQFHVFMLDVPQATFVALVVWLVLASDRFRRMDVAALAGLALGLGVLSKQLAPLYLVGLVPAVLARGGGWRNWRGLAAFVAVALVVGAPWYLVNSGTLSEMFEAGLGGERVPPLARPALLSLANLDWYLFATLNGLLFAPLFAFAAVGIGAGIGRVVRARGGADLTFELLAGLGGTWVVLTVMPHHDMRYTISAIVYLAVLAAVWIARLPRAPGAVAVTGLVLAVLAAQAGATLGLGGTTSRVLPGSRFATWGEGVPPLSGVVVYSNHDFLVSGPERDGDVLRLFRALREEEIRSVAWLDDGYGSTPYSRSPYFDGIGLMAFAYVAHLQANMQPWDSLPPSVDRAIVIRSAAGFDGTEPCTTLTDGSGVWVRIGDPVARDARNYCPWRRPPLYGR